MLSPSSTEKTTSAAQVPRVAYLKLQKQLTDERCTFLREINALRATIVAAQQQPHRERQAHQQQLQFEDSSISIGSGSPIGPGKRFASVAHMQRSDTSMSSDKVVLVPPPVVHAAPELMSMKLLSEALASAQLLTELKELHAEELAEKDREMEALRVEVAQQLEEGEASWRATLRSTMHQEEILRDTYEHERERFRMEAKSLVGDELRKEREDASLLRLDVTRLREETALLKNQLVEGTTEIRNLRVQVATLQQERATTGIERAECRTALMAISAEKSSLERRVRQLEARASAVPSAPKFRGNEGHSSRFPRASVYAPRKSVFSESARRSPSTTSVEVVKDQALEHLMEFALDGDMAKSVKSSVVRARAQQEQPT